MTPEERAEKIVLELQHFANDTEKNKILFVAAEIRKAEDEAWKMGVEAGTSLSTGVIQGVKAQAYEDAAKVVETPIENGLPGEPCDCYDCDCHGECPQRYYADKIRARAKEMK